MPRAVCGVHCPNSEVSGMAALVPEQADADGNAGWGVPGGWGAAGGNAAWGDRGVGPAGWAGEGTPRCRGSLRSDAHILHIISEVCGEDDRLYLKNISNYNSIAYSTTGG
jgi:hypothetical protein